MGFVVLIVVFVVVGGAAAAARRAPMFGTAVRRCRACATDHPAFAAFCKRCGRQL